MTFFLKVLQLVYSTYLHVLALTLSFQALAFFLFLNWNQVRQDIDIIEEADINWKKERKNALTFILFCPKSSSFLCVVENNETAYYFFLFFSYNLIYSMSFYIFLKRYVNVMSNDAKLLTSSWMFLGFTSR